jgi:hypothetical protein
LAIANNTAITLGVKISFLNYFIICAQKWYSRVITQVYF